MCRSWLAPDDTWRGGSQLQAEGVSTHSPGSGEASPRLGPTATLVKRFPGPAGAACPPHLPRPPRHHTLWSSPRGLLLGHPTDQDRPRNRESSLWVGEGAGHCQVAGKVGRAGSGQAWPVGGKAASGRGGAAGVGREKPCFLQKTHSLPLCGVRAPHLPRNHSRRQRLFPRVLGPRAGGWRGAFPPAPLLPYLRSGSCPRPAERSHPKTQTR